MKGVGAFGFFSFSFFFLFVLVCAKRSLPSSSPFCPILQFLGFLHLFHVISRIIQYLQSKIKTNKNLKIIIMSSINWAERYCKNNTFLTLTNTLTPKFCSSSSKTKLKILEKENKIQTHFYRNHDCT